MAYTAPEDVQRFIFEEVFQQNISTLNNLSRDSSRFFHKLDLIIYSRTVSEIQPAVDQRKPTQK